VRGFDSAPGLVSKKLILLCFWRLWLAAQGAGRAARHAHIAALRKFTGYPAFAQSHRRQEIGAPPAHPLLDRRCNVAPMSADAFARAEALEAKPMRNEAEPAVTVTAPMHEPILPVVAACAAFDYFNAVRTDVNVVVSFDPRP